MNFEDDFSPLVDPRIAHIDEFEPDWQWLRQDHRITLRHVDPGSEITFADWLVEQPADYLAAHGLTTTAGAS
jgi:hypothetical protein